MRGRGGKQAPAQRRVQRRRRACISRRPESGHQGEATPHCCLQRGKVFGRAVGLLLAVHSNGIG